MVAKFSTSNATRPFPASFFFFLNDPAPTDIYPLPQPDALPIPDRGVAGVPHEVTHQRVIDDALEPADEVLQHRGPGKHPDGARERPLDDGAVEGFTSPARSEEHTSELQSQSNLVCRLLLEKKKQ